MCVCRYTHTCNSNGNGVRTATVGHTLMSLARPIGIFPGAGLVTHRNTLTVPLAWCWHPKSNLDHTRFLAPSTGLMFLPFIATPA